MNLDPETCYRALESRDRRFDGRFFTGVKTTGIYCRPICPARTPLRKNVEFYSCAAAAEDAGFRACNRCRPDTAPGSPAWEGTSSTVNRGLRLIAEGALDEGDTEQLARRLGVGARHLSRLFKEHIGATPKAVAQTRRLHFTRKLLEETDLPMTDVAHAAGFPSIRRFNSAVRATFHCTPSELRRKRSARLRDHDGEGWRLRLAYRPPLDWDELLAFLRLRAIPGVESVSADSYRRAFILDDSSGWLEVRAMPDQHSLALTVFGAEPRLLPLIAERVRSVFDLSADTSEVREYLRSDAMLRQTLRRYPGLRVPGAWDGFELAVRAVVGQQVSVKGASTLMGRFAERFGQPVTTDDDTICRVFPSAAALAEADLAGIGMPRARSDAIRSLAMSAATGDVDLTPSADLAATRDRLLAHAGIGPWTVEYIAMRALRDPDAFPATDLVLRKAASRNGKPAGGKQLAEWAERWKPWRAYAAVHLWKSAALASSAQ